METIDNQVVENYRDIAGYEGYYQVSDLGNVRSLTRKVAGRSVSRSRATQGRQFAPCPTNPYYRVDLCKEGKPKSFSVHRLVAIAFISNPEGLPQVNHKNGQKHDNRAENLEWVSGRQNIAHSVKAGLHIRGERIHGAKLTAEQVLEIRRLASIHTQTALSKKFGVSVSSINQIIHRRNWTHI